MDRPLVFFDIESTGLHIIRDRIIQIALIKFTPGKEEPDELVKLINPEIPIPDEAVSVHGFTNEDLRDKPTFRDVAGELYDFIGDADLAGYNSNRFDIPFLMEEFARAGFDFDIASRRLIDVQRIFYKMEPRTLRAAMRFYCHKELEDAHDALADVRATIEVLNGQLDKYEGHTWIDQDGQSHPNPVVRDVEALHQFTSDLRMADATQRLKYDKDGNLVFNFGVNTGKPVGETLYHDPKYLQWMLKKDFSAQVKKLILAETEKYKEQRENDKEK